MSRNITLEKHSKAKRLGSSHSPAPQFWEGPLNSEKVSVPAKNGPFERVKKKFWTPQKKFHQGNGCDMCFLQKNWKKSVKFGLGGRSNISLPRIGGSHPVPSLSLLLTERRGYSNVLCSIPPWCSSRGLQAASDPQSPQTSWTPARPGPGLSESPQPDQRKVRKLRTPPP